MRVALLSIDDEVKNPSSTDAAGNPVNTEPAPGATDGGAGSGTGNETPAPADNTDPTDPGSLDNGNGTDTPEVPADPKQIAAADPGTGAGDLPAADVDAVEQTVADDAAIAEANELDKALDQAPAEEITDAAQDVVYTALESIARRVRMSSAARRVVMESMHTSRDFRGAAKQTIREIRHTVNVRRGR